MGWPFGNIKMTAKTIIPVLLLVLLGIIWGSGYSIARYCVTHGVPPLGYSFWQSLGPAVFLWLTVKARRLPFPMQAHYLRYYVLCGVLGIALPNSLMYFSVQHLPSGWVAVLVNTVPIWIYPLSLLLAQERFDGRRLLAVLIGFVGIALMVWSHFGTLSLHHVPWVLLVLLVPFSFALCAVFIAAFRPLPSDSVSLSAGMLLVSTLCIIPFMLTGNRFYPLSWPLTIPDYWIMVEMVLSSIGYVILFALLKRAGPVFYSFVGGVVSITGLFWGWLVFHETLTWPIAGGVVLILLAVVAISLLKRKDLAVN